MPRRRRRRSLAGPVSTPSSSPETRELETWKAKINHARRMRQQWEEQFAVELLERYYLGEHTHLGTYTPERTEIWLNHFAATIQTQRPALLPQQLSFLVEARPGQPHTDRVQLKAQAGVLEAIAGQDGHLLKSVRLAMTQAFFRIGVLKVCYEPALEKNPLAGQPLLAAMDQALLGGDAAGPVEPDELVTDEVYRWRWVNAKNMLLPDAGPDSTRWPWIAEEIEVPLEEAKEDARFPVGKRRQLKSNGRAQDTQQRYADLRSGHDALDHGMPMFRYIECWDTEERRVYCWADGQDFDGYLMEEPYPDGIEDHPYALFCPTPIIAPEPLPWPKPLTYDWLPMQVQYNILRRQMIEGGKRSARKILYDEGTFPDAEEAQKFLVSPLDMEGVKIQDVGRPPIVVSEASLGADVARNIPFLLNDWQRVTGSSGTRLGNPDANTATEAVITEQAAGVRDGELRTLVTEWLSEAGRKMLQLVKQTLTLDLWVQLKDLDDRDLQAFLQSPGFAAYLGQRIGEEQVPQYLQLIQTMPGMQDQFRQQFGQLKPLKVTRSQLEFETDVTVKPSTIRPVYRAQLLQLMQVLGPMALMSPTLLEELLLSFELPQGDRIATEILQGIRQQQQQQMLLKAQGGGQVPGTPTPSQGANPIGSQNPLGAVSGIRGV